MSLKEELEEYLLLAEKHPELRTLKQEQFYQRLRELEAQGELRIGEKKKHETKSPVHTQDEPPGKGEKLK